MLYVDYLFINDYNSDERRSQALLIAVSSLSLSAIERIADDILNNLDSSRELNSSVQFYFVLSHEDAFAVKANKNDCKRAYSNATRRLNRLVSREYAREAKKAYTITACKNVLRFVKRARDYEQLSDDDKQLVSDALAYAREYERNVSIERVEQEQRKFHELCRQLNMKL